MFLLWLKRKNPVKSGYIQVFDRLESQEKCQVSGVDIALGETQVGQSQPCQHGLRPSGRLIAREVKSAQRGKLPKEIVDSLSTRHLSVAGVDQVVLGQI